MAYITINGVTFNSPDKVSFDVSAIRKKLQNSQISIEEAKSEIDAAAKAYATMTSPQGTQMDGSKYSQTSQALLGQTFSGLGNVTQPDGQIYSVDSSGNANKVSATVHQSTTTGGGTSSYTGNSIVDYLKSTGQASDMASRTALATKLGIQNYEGTAEQNTRLLNSLQSGSAPQPTGSIPSPTYTSSNGASGGAYSGTGGYINSQGVYVPNGSANGGSAGQGGYPKPTPTGNATLDEAQNQQYEYVMGSLDQGYAINPALTGSSLANMLPQFIRETASQLEPELLQNFKTEMVGVTNSLSKLTTIYQNSQGQTVQDFQQSLGKLRDQTSMVGGGERALEQGLTNSANRSLSSLDTNYATDASGVLNSAGAALGPGVFRTLLDTTGSAPTELQNFSAYNLPVPSTYSKKVTNQGGDSVFAGQAEDGRTLNFNYNPSNYTYGSIPATYGQDFGNSLNQLFGNYQKGVAATPSGSSRTLTF